MRKMPHQTTEQRILQGYKHTKEGAKMIYENREALEKYLFKLRSLMAECGDQTAIDSINNDPDYNEIKNQNYF